MFENWPNEDAVITDPLINYYIFAALIVIPLYKIIKRVGLKPSALLTILIPYVGWLVTIAFIAHPKWPIMQNMITKNRHSS